MKNNFEFAALLYNFTHIPIYCLSGTNLLFSLPAEGADYLPCQEDCQDLLRQEADLAYKMTDFGGLYGFIRDKQSGNYFLTGPVSSVPYEKKHLQIMHRLFRAAQEEYTAFDSYFQRLPIKSMEDFLNYLSLFFYSLNGESMIPRGISDAGPSADDPVSARFISLEYEDKEMGIHNNSYFVEKKFLSFVEKGDMDGIKQFSVTSDINGGIIADDMLRQLKNIFIVTTTLVSRAAIQGGLSTGIAFHLSDSYILQAEGLLTAGSLHALTGQMIHEYTRRVAEAKVYRSSDPVLFHAIQFVRQNTNRRITVGDVADHVGLSKNYLSAYFKKEMGFELNAFIRRCKLEESRELLLYTEKSLAEISNYLCFSSQSYFQTLFKEQFGVTPLHYRRQRKI